jgi:hypothetical protein
LPLLRLLPGDEKPDRERLLLLAGARVAGEVVTLRFERDARAGCDRTFTWRVPVEGADFPGSRRLLPIFLDSLLLITMPRLPEYPAGAVDT